MQEEEKHTRELQSVSEPERVHSILTNHLNGKSMVLKNIAPGAEVTIESVLETKKNEILVNTGGFDLSQAKDEITLFRVLGRYVELHCDYKRQDSTSGYHVLTVKSASIATRQRQFARIGIPDTDIYITNIRTSKHSIQASMFNVPTSVKLNFQMFQEKLRPTADVVKIDVYNKRNNVLDEIRKTGKPLLLKDATAPSSYEPETDQYINYSGYLGVELQDKIEEYRRAKVISEVIVPIEYKTAGDEQIPLGYIQLQSRGRHFDQYTVEQLQKTASDLVHRIQETNTVYIQERQKVINVSRGGLKVLITHEDLKEYLIKQQSFSFDLVFKMQAPITLLGLIRSAARNMNGDLLLGIQISGSSSRGEDLKRFYDNVGALEQSIREKLLKQKRQASGH